MRSNGGDPLVEMSLVTCATLVIGGVFAGYVNAVAGGGSAVTIPLFMWCGLDASMANGTNRVSVGIQAVSATASFRREGVGSVGHAVGPIVWTLIGATGGALMVVQLDPSFLNVLFSVIFLVLAFGSAVGPDYSKSVRSRPQKRSRSRVQLFRRRCLWRCFSGRSRCTFAVGAGSAWTARCCTRERHEGPRDRGIYRSDSDGLSRYGTSCVAARLTCGGWWHSR